MYRKFSSTLIGATLMNLTDLQHQLTQTAKITLTLFVFAPALVLMIPLLLPYFALRSLGTLLRWFGSLFHGMTKQAQPLVA